MAYCATIRWKHLGWRRPTCAVSNSSPHVLQGCAPWPPWSRCWFTTHRYDTIRKADTIVVLLDGRIAEIGTHEELASHTREFWSLFLAQGLHPYP